MLGKHLVGIFVAWKRKNFSDRLIKVKEVASTVKPLLTDQNKLMRLRFYF